MKSSRASAKYHRTCGRLMCASGRVRRESPAADYFTSEFEVQRKPAEMVRL